MNNANTIRTPRAIPCPEATDLGPRLPSLCENESPSRLLDYDLGSSLACHCECCITNTSAGLPCWCVIGAVGRAKLRTLLCRTSPVQWSLLATNLAERRS